MIPQVLTSGAVSSRARAQMIRNHFPYDARGLVGPALAPLRASAGRSPRGRQNETDRSCSAAGQTDDASYRPPGALRLRRNAFGNGVAFVCKASSISLRRTNEVATSAASAASSADASRLRWLRHFQPAQSPARSGLPTLVPVASRSTTATPNVFWRKCTRWRRFHNQGCR